jgi:tetratricopeptide (TPR) repeat protein
MEVEKKARIWRLVKIPLVVIISILVVTVITVTLSVLIKGVRIKKAVQKTRASLSHGSYDQFEEGMDSLKVLLEKYPDREDVLSTAAWAYASGSYFFYGKDSEYFEEYRKTAGKMPKAGGDDLFWAASALALIMDDKYDEAGKLTKEKMQEYKDSDELKFANALSLVAAANKVEATIELELLHARSKPFIPAMLVLASLKKSSGDNVGSLAILLEILQFQPDNLLALIESAHMEMAVGGSAAANVEKKIKKIKPSLKHAPAAVRARGYLAIGKLLIGKEKYEEAVEPLSESYKINPADKETAHALALADRKTGSPLKAIKILEGMDDVKALPTGLLVEMAESGLITGRTAMARAAAEELILRTDFDTASAHALAGKALVHSGAYVDAVSHFSLSGQSDEARIRTAFIMARAGKLAESAKTLKSMSRDENLPCATVIYEYYFRKGVDALSDTEALAACPACMRFFFLESAGMFAELFNLAKKENEALESPFNLYYLAAASWRTMGQKVAREELDKILKFAPDSMVLLDKTASLYLAMGRFKEALQTAEQAVEKNPADPKAHALVVRILAEIGQPQESEKRLDEAIKTFPDDPALLVQQARILYEKDKADEAVAALDKAMAGTILAQELALAGPLYAAACMKLDDEKKAEEQILGAARKVEKYFDPAASLDLYAAYIALKLEEKGKKNVTKAKGMFTSRSKKPFPSARILHEGARVYLAEGDREAAVEKLQQALASDPAYKPAYQALLDLDSLSEIHRKNYVKIFGQEL